MTVFEPSRCVTPIVEGTIGEAICDDHDNLELRQIAEARMKDGKMPIPVSFDDL